MQLDWKRVSAGPSLRTGSAGQAAVLGGVSPLALPASRAAASAQTERGVLAPRRSLHQGHARVPRGGRVRGARGRAGAAAGGRRAAGAGALYQHGRSAGSGRLPPGQPAERLPAASCGLPIRATAGKEHHQQSCLQTLQRLRDPPGHLQQRLRGPWLHTECNSSP